MKNEASQSNGASTLNIGSAQIIVPTEDLFVAWLEKHLGARSSARAVPELREGEFYAGIIFGKKGAPNHHLILLPGERSKIGWVEGCEWAASIGGELPTRREQSLLFTNLKEQFQSEYYWSSEQYSADAAYAWNQHFYDGLQYDFRKTFEGRARAVRRSIIS